METRKPPDICRIHAEQLGGIEAEAESMGAGAKDFRHAMDHGTKWL